MKIRNFLVAALLALNLVCPLAGKAQNISMTPAQQAALNPVNLKNYGAFKKSVAPLIKEMGVKKIVGLGEGTHGTAEFYKLRYYITRILIEEHGFNHVAFENDVTAVWQFNRELASTKDLKALMQKYLISLWQNEETRELFKWIKEYNASNKNKVSVDGIDYPAQLPDVVMIKQLLAAANITSFNIALATITKAASMQDDAWSGMNKKGFKTDWKVLGLLAKQGYISTDSLEKVIHVTKMDTVIKTDLLLAIVNLKQGFEPFYKPTPESARDSIMAYNTAKLIKTNNDKVVIWAHNAHLGKTGIYGNAVGGTGGFILKHFPGNYFALGTGTALGTFGGTTDARAVNNSIIAPYTLEKPIAGSWEELLSAANIPNFYFNTLRLNPDKALRPLRFVGYGTKSGEKSYDTSNLTDLFDAFIFLKNTNAPTPLK
jgi:erythromycin esterase